MKYAVEDKEVEDKEMEKEKEIDAIERAYGTIDQPAVSLQSVNGLTAKFALAT